MTMKTTRRSFLKTAAAGVAVPLILPSGVLPAHGQSGALSSTAGPPDNMTKWGPKLSEEEVARIAGLSVPELADMLRTGDTVHAYAALSRLKADGGVARNLDLLLGIAAETRGDMIVEGLARPVEASAGDQEKQVVDRLLDLLEAAYGGTIESNALVESIDIHRAWRDGKMLPDAG